MYPYFLVTDYRNHNTEDCSNINGPEHRVSYVNEFEDALTRITAEHTRSCLP